jgi:hypothetical protein
VPADRTGSFLGAVGGLVFVEVGAGAFPRGVEITLRLAGVVCFVVVLGVLRRRAQRPSPVGTGPGRGLGAGYAAVVVGELVALVVGLRLLSGPFDTPEAAPAWVALVVGTHFFALAALVRERAFTQLGCAITVCGAAAFAAALLGAPDAVVAGLAGVAPGAVLLASTALSSGSASAAAVT